MTKKYNVSFIMFLALVLLISTVSCDPGRKLEKEEEEKIEDFLASNTGIDFVLQSSGLYYLELLAGTGVMPVASDSAFVWYTGTFLNGTRFDSNVDSGTPYGFIIGENIAGFDEGVMLMKEGGKAKLLLPSKLAYGTYGSYPYIAGYTPLIFDIELIRVVPGPWK
jgi:FKBP-type peptidyl-prolyl cis-trans isomerase